MAQTRFCAHQRPFDKLIFFARRRPRRHRCSHPWTPGRPKMTPWHGQLRSRGRKAELALCLLFRRQPTIQGRRVAMSSREPSITICLTTHDRVDCAKINQEIFKLNFRTPFRVVHACSGAQAAPYLEDAFLWCEPKPINAGAINLIQRALELACRRHAPDYLVHLEADTWILDEQVILRYVYEMERNPHLLLATSAWWSVSPWRRTRNAVGAMLGRPAARLKHRFDIIDFSTQFFIVRNDPTVLRCILDMPAEAERRAERQFFDAYVSRFGLD